MSNFQIQSTTILGKEIQICVTTTQNVTVPPKGMKTRCDILGFQAKVYLSPKKDSFWTGFNHISLEAITICTYMNIDLSTIDKVNEAINGNVEIINKWEEIRAICNSDWNSMLNYMNGLASESTPDLNTIAQDELMHSGYDNLKVGDIALSGTTRKIIFNEDSIALEAIVRSGGLGGMLDDSARIQNESIFIEDLRGITVYEGKGTGNMLFTTMFGGDRDKAVLDSISYIRFEIKGVNDIRTYSPTTHPYTVTIRGDQVQEALKFKMFLDKKIKEYRNNGKQSVIIQNNSSADELLKYSELRDKGLISNEEFEQLKKKILGL
jgi:hypothetical protein